MARWNKTPGHGGETSSTRAIGFPPDSQVLETLSSVVPVPPEGSSDLDEDPIAEHRFDRKPLQLERRGVTPQNEERFVKPRQGFLFAKELIWKESIVAKLDEGHRNELANKIRSCHTEKSVRMCNGCRRASFFWNRCDVKWCPICAEKLAHERRESVTWWTKQIEQPKHMVLTRRNTETLSKEDVRSFKDSFTKLRRRKFASNWKGGFYALEVTNESRGWHLHLHALVDARWIDSGELARTWAEIIGQDFAIVKVKDAREGSYLSEVTKYAVKGNDLAGWSTPDIVTLIEALEGVKCFGVFGSLYGKRTEWREFLDELQAGRVRCECGCSSWRIMSEAEFTWETEVTIPNMLARPPTPLIESMPACQPQMQLT